MLLKIDQLTIVRNHVRKWLSAHEESAEGDSVSEIAVEVVWQNGDIEEMVFDSSVGFPISPARDWFEEWLREASF